MRTKAMYTVALTVLVLFLAHIIPFTASSKEYELFEEPHEGWSDDIRLTEHERNDRKPRMTTWGNVVHMVWDKSLGEDHGYVEVFYMKSVDSGWTWSEPIQLSEHEYPAWNQDIAVHEDTVFVVWDQHGPASAREIFFRCSLDGGDTWEEEQQITQPTGEHKTGPSIAVSDDGMTVHVAWIDARHGGILDTDIYYVRSLDGGLTWEEEVRITDAPWGSTGPRFAVDGETVHLLWYDERKGYMVFDIYYLRSTDNGATWEEEVALSDSPNVDGRPDVAVWEGNVHVVWYEIIADQDYAINYRRSTDGGDTWEPMQVLTAPSARVMYPRLAVIGDDVHVVWVDGRDHDYRREIYYKHSEDVGVSWSEDTRLTYSDEGRSYEPAITLSGDNIHVAWHDDRDGDYYEIYYKRNPEFPPDDDPPAIYNVNITNITHHSAVVEWNTDRPADSTVRYSECSDLSDNITVHTTKLVKQHSILIDDIEYDTTYYFEVSSTGELGGTTVDDNNGNYYSFTTLDLPPPEIYDVNIGGITEFTAVIEWSTDRPADSTVRYSENPDLSDHITVHEHAYVTEHSLTLEGLEHNTTYYFEVSSADEDGRTTTDDNHGEYYYFATLAVPPPEITNIRVRDITEFTAVVEWSTDVPANSTVRYSIDADLSEFQSVHSPEFVTTHALRLDNLIPCTIYYFELSSTNVYGKITIDDNKGTYHSFITLPVPPPEIQDFSSRSAYTGEEFSFVIITTSEINISDVRLMYGFNERIDHNISMQENEGTWGYILNIPENAVTLVYTIRATDISGGSNSTPVRTLHVIDIIPPTARAGDDVTVEPGTTVSFDASQSYDNIGIIRYSWHMTVGGRTVILLGSAPTFTFNNAGEYTITLTVEDAAGNTDTDSLTVVVHRGEQEELPEVEDGGFFLGYLLLIPAAMLVSFLIYRHNDKKR